MTSVRNTNGDRRVCLDGRLAAYLAATGAAGAVLAGESQAAIVANTAIQPVGINGAVPIDFNGDGQFDFEIDHDRVDLGGGNLVDYLQIDKNDFNGASLGEVLLAINANDVFPLNGTIANDPIDAKYVTPTAADTDYPAALTFGTPISGSSPLLFQESDAYAFSKTIRSNRLIDEDAGQADMALGGLAAGQLQAPTNGPNFLGLGGQVRYLGVQMDLNGTNQFNYGWIGIRITNEADATGEVTGYAYESIAGKPIPAGAVPEPSTIVSALTAGAVIFGRFVRQRLRGR